MFEGGWLLVGVGLLQATLTAPEALGEPPAETVTAAEVPLIPAFFTAETLYDICTRPNAGQCSMYVAGTLDGMFFMGAAQGDRRFCLPPTTNRKMSDVVVEYLEAHPEIRDKAAAAVIHQAVAETYPCEPETSEEEGTTIPVD